MDEDIKFDWQRGVRTGVPEAVLCAGKASDQILRIAKQAQARHQPILLTRLDDASAQNLAPLDGLDYDPLSQTAVLGGWPEAVVAKGDVAVVTAGTSDLPTAREVQRCLRFFGAEAELFADVGVAGLWRLQAVEPELRHKRVIIAVAGMEGALFSVLAGLVPAMVIAVPSPVGYGVSQGGEAALSSALSSCAPGVVTVNIGNGFGAAAAAWKVVAPR